MADAKAITKANSVSTPARCPESFVYRSFTISSLVLLSNDPPDAWPWLLLSKWGWRNQKSETRNCLRHTIGVRRKLHSCDRRRRFLENRTYASFQYGGSSR